MDNLFIINHAELPQTADLQNYRFQSHYLNIR